MSKIYSAFTLIDDVIDYKNNGGACNRFQFFISDPTRLRLLDMKTQQNESRSGR